MALIWLAAEGFGIVDFPRGAGSGRRALRACFVCCTRPYWAPRRAPTPSCARTGFRTPTTVRPPLICPDLSQCGPEWGGMERSVQISALLVALLVHEHRAVHCHARGERAHSGSMQCARICGLTATEPCVAMRQRSARILGAESCWRHCRVRSGALLGCCGDLLPDALDAVGLEVAVLRHHA